MNDYRDYLAHHGILGMKWGIRRFRNYDGTLTNAGRKRYDSPGNLRYKKTAKEQEARKEKRRIRVKQIAKGLAAAALVGGAGYAAYKLSKKAFGGPSKVSHDPVTQAFRESRGEDPMSKWMNRGQPDRASVNRVEPDRVTVNRVEPKRVNAGDIFRGDDGDHQRFQEFMTNPKYKDATLYFDGKMPTDERNRRRIAEQISRQVEKLEGDIDREGKEISDAKKATNKLYKTLLDAQSFPKKPRRK